MNIIDYQFSLTSWSLFFIEKDKRNNIKHISYVGLCLITDAWLLALKVFPSINCIYVAQWDKQDWVVSSIINIERSYANRILEVSMDKIINTIFFEKEKILNLLCDLHMFYLFCYILV